MKEKRIIRDPIHGYISYPYDGIISQLVDTPEFQRLRLIRQLGLTSYVFPGADHSRFSHSLGAYHLALKIDRLLNGDEKCDNVELYVAALLHDLGHTPLSHALERQINPWKHEVTTEKIILDDSSEVNEVLKENGVQPSKVIEVLKGPTKPPYQHYLVSSQLDVDRLDYLVRDSYYTGNPCGAIDLERLVQTVRLSKDRNLRVSPKGLHTVEHYLISRYTMYYQVYWHKAKVCCEKLLAMANKRVKNLAMDGKFEPSDAYERAIIGENINLQDFISLTDADVFSHLYSWRHNNDPILADLSGRIIARKLLKVVERNNLVSGGESLILQTWKNQDKMKSLVKGLKLDPEYYLILEEEGIEAYKPYGAAMKDKEDAIFTTEEKDIEDYIRPPKEYRVWYFFVPNGIESEVEKLLG